MNLIVIDNDVDDAGLSANDVVIVSGGTGYTKVGPSAYTATVGASESANTATMNVHVEVTLSCNTTFDGKFDGTSGTSVALASANAGYTVSGTAPGQFAIGEAVRVVGEDFTTSDIKNPMQVDTSGTVATFNDSGLSSNSGYGIITGRTFIDSDSSKNVASITIKTNANNAGFFKPGTFIRADNTAQQLAVTGLSNHTEMFMAVGTVRGVVANVVPVTVGSGYLTAPAVTISTPGDEAGGFVAPTDTTVKGQRDGSPAAGTTASVVIRGEDSVDGGNINAKYVSRRVTLNDGFDASDLKVIISAFKPLGTGINVYYKVKSDEDPESFDDKSYVLMNQETANTLLSTSEEDIKEFTFKTANDSISYTSGGATHDRFKTFAIKIVMTSNNAVTVPKLRDMRAIALDS